MPTRPEDVVNRALDECGIDEIGDLYEGSKASKAALRIYDPILRQLHSAVHWNFARRQQQLVLRGDVSGQYNTNTVVASPWSYMYEWPVDAVHARYIQRRGATSLDTTTMEPIGAQPAWSAPAPFLVGDAPLPNDVDSDWGAVEGHNPESTRVIFTNELGAILVFTGLIQYPDAWDPLFEQAMVACLAARLAMPLIEDKDVALAIRRDNIAIAREALGSARVRDGNEGWTVVDHTPDWIRARTNGAAISVFGGTLYNSWLPMPMVEDAGGVY